MLRRFLAATGLLLLPKAAWAKKIAIPLNKVEKLKKVGGWTILKIKKKQIIFIRDAQDSIRALSPVCTHKKCLVGYNPDAKKIECSCHRSTYDLTGKVLDGPAPKPLPSYPAELSQDRIIIKID
jgi:cytochrome b6-f complex iron-sulfur subunit